MVKPKLMNVRMSQKFFSTNNSDNNTDKKSLRVRLMEKIYYWYHRMAIGFYQDVLAYDMEGFFDRRHLFEKKQKYGGDIPFIGATRWHDRRHYRDWVRIERPVKWEMTPGDEDMEFVDFYLGGYLSEWNAFDIEEFDRGCIEFDFVFPEANKPDYINYDLTEHPTG